MLYTDNNVSHIYTLFQFPQKGSHYSLLRSPTIENFADHFIVIFYYYSSSSFGKRFYFILSLISWIQRIISIYVYVSSIQWFDLLFVIYLCRTLILDTAHPLPVALIEALATEFSLWRPRSHTQGSSIKVIIYAVFQYYRDLLNFFFKLACVWHQFQTLDLDYSLMLMIETRTGHTPKCAFHDERRGELYLS